MSRGEQAGHGRSGDITVLFVADEPDVSVRAATRLERHADQFSVLIEPTAAEALDRLEVTDVDCVVSDVKLPDTSGPAFLATVSERSSELPTILRAAPHNGDLVASAISSGVTDYIPRGRGLEQPGLLATRIKTAVDDRPSAETKGRYQRLVEETSDVIMIVNTDGGFQYLGPSAERVLGYDPSDLEGAPVDSYVHPEDREEVRDLFSELVASPPSQATTEFRFKRADGSWVWLEGRGRNLLDDPSIGGIVVAARDITDTKQRQRELRESEQRYRRLLETSPGPIFIYSTGGELVYVNEAGVDLLDAETKNDLIGTESGNFTHPDERGTVDDRYDRLVRDREPVPPIELKLLSTEGETKYAVMASTPVSYDGEPAIQTVGMDITEAKERERQLQRERDRFTTLFENLPSPVVHGVLDDGDPIIRDVNDRFEEVFDCEAGGSEGTNLDDLIVPAGRREEALALNEQIRADGVIRTEVRRQTADGLRDFELRAVIDSDAEVPEGYAIYTDITERKERERELQRKKTRLDEFATVVSHDLRNPLRRAGNLNSSGMSARASGSTRLTGHIVGWSRLSTMF